ncbi:hypothetical protein J19TS1_24550 [Heyndrickxia oleronia]|nr:hypothetical protein J19TS1_24550 [Heyndrickxia oleronia]
MIRSPFLVGSFLSGVKNSSIWLQDGLNRYIGFEKGLLVL